MAKKSLLLILLLAMATGIKAEIGDFIFVKVNDYYNMLFKVISDNEVMLSQVDQMVTGSVSIPGYVTDDNEQSYLVTKIGGSAFYNCYHITDIIIPNTVKTICSSAFSKCDGLTSVSLPASLTILESQSFSNCDNLKSISVSKNLQFMNGGFDNCPITSVTIDPDNPYLSLQGDLLYQTNEGKKTLIMHLNASTITSFDVPSGVNKIGMFVFENSPITRCSLPESLKEIDYRAFQYSKLQEIDIPSSVTKIEYHAFRACHDLKSVIMNRKYDNDSGYQFEDIAEDAVLTVPLNLKSHYEEEPWVTWFSAIHTYVPITETYFPDEAFRSALLEGYEFGSDGRLMEEEFAETEVLDDYLWDVGIEDLTGIEHFTELTELAFGINKVKRVDLSKNTKLKYIHCETNQICDEDMDYFISHLPTVTSNNGSLFVLDNTRGVAEGNEMTPEQVTTAYNKGWRAVKAFDPKTNQFKNTAGFWQIREKWFPDAALRHALNEIQFLYGNTVVTREDAMNREELELGGETEIQDLTGIELFDLYFTNNKVKRADLSKNTNLTRIGCELNQMSGDDMDYFVNHLPQAAGDTRKISVYRGSDSSFAEGNEMTPEQVAVANGKGWTVTVYNDIENKDCETDGFWRITESRFPDPVFRQMLDTSFRCKGALTKEDVNEVEEFDLTGLGISDLKGIEYFTEMKSLLVSCNLLTTINLSMNNKLTSLEIYKNNIKGEGMDALVASLPTVPMGEGFIAVYDTSGDYPEGNIMTPEQVAEARSKHWFPKVWDSKMKKWVDYDGYSTPTGIGEAVLQNDQDAPAYNLNGQRVNRDYRGIVIRKGRKTLNN